MTIIKRFTKVKCGYRPGIIFARNVLEEVNNVTTRQLEISIYRTLAKMGTYLCFEVMMPGAYENGFRAGRNYERVDLLTYDTTGTWRFYELKISKKDFYSKNAVTFKGHLNYYVMPGELYDQVKDDIPPGVGVYKAREHEPHFCDCIKKAKRQALDVDEEKLKNAFMQALSREHGKYRRLLAAEGGAACGLQYATP